MPEARWRIKAEDQMSPALRNAANSPPPKGSRKHYLDNQQLKHKTRPHHCEKDYQNKLWGSMKLSFRGVPCDSARGRKRR